MGGVFFAVLIGVGILIYKLVYIPMFHATRDKFKDEEFKFNFLEKKFFHLKGTKEQKQTGLRGIKTITEISVYVPYRKTTPWKVSKFEVIKNSFPFNDTSKWIEIYSVMDENLENSKEYKDALAHYNSIHNKDLVGSFNQNDSFTQDMEYVNDSIKVKDNIVRDSKVATKKMKFCSQCGQEYYKTLKSKFCINCGNKIDYITY
jgi:hypothetical protein